MEQNTWKIIVRGRVQGVFFRASSKATAQELGLTGWARNERDGSVHILVQGEELALNSFLEWVHRGPEGAKVENVNWKEVEENESFQNFSIRR